MTAFIAGLLAVATIFFVSDVVGQWNGKKLSLGTLRAYPREFKFYLLALFVLSIGSLPVAVMLLKTQDIGLSIANIPLFYMLYNVSYIIFSAVGGKIGDKIGTKKVMMAGYIILLLGYAFIGIANTTPVLIIAFLVLGFFPALTDGTARAYAATITEEGDRAGAYGLMNAATGFGLLVAGILGGYLWQHFGIPTALAISSVFIILGLFVIYISSPKNSALVATK
jgi:MFS family permease